MSGGMKRHIGKITNTDQRCAVVFMQIAGRPTHALVVGIDNLPDRFEQALMAILESPEGQSSTVLADILGRRIFQETGKSFLETLHEFGLLAAVPVDNVVMLPFPNMPFPLRKILEDMGNAVPHLAPETLTPAQQYQAMLAQQQTANAPPTTTDKFNAYGQIQQIETTDQNRGVASMLLAQAVDLESVANAKREEAYRYDPSLRPQIIPPVQETRVLIEETPAKAKRVRAKKPAE